MPVHASITGGSVHVHGCRGKHKLLKGFMSVQMLLQHFIQAPKHSVTYIDSPETVCTFGILVRPSGIWAVKILVATVGAYVK